ncbi:hypothetical protein LCGC14_3048830, partial [marine sediment metagenome]
MSILEVTVRRQRGAQKTKAARARRLP